jgi:large subunit ribosomal protein L4
MSKIPQYNRTGAANGEVEVADELLVLDRGTQAVQDVVLAGMAGRRAGTASTLRKGEVAGSNKKLWRQKGTGRARVGLRQSPVWRGGGVAFGPHPRNYAQKINKKLLALAFRRALSDRIAEGAVRIVDDLSVAEPRTKLVAGLLKGLGLEGALLVTHGVDKTLALAARNLPKVQVLGARDVGVYHLVRHKNLVVSRAAWDVLEARLAGKAVEEETQP